MSKPIETRVCLRFWGDDLDPADVSSRLGHPPAKSTRKGDLVVGRVTRQRSIATTDGWQLESSEQSGRDLDDQIDGIFKTLTSDLAVWHSLTGSFRADVFCGIFLGTGNDGLSLDAVTLQMLGARGLHLELDIYDSSDA